MNQPQISVLLAGIRQDKWPELVESIHHSFSGQWELILAGPYAPSQLPVGTQLERIVFMSDWGNPTRCYQRALLEAQAPIILWAFDDGLFEPGALDRSLELIKLYWRSQRTEPHIFEIYVSPVISHRYIEGESSPGTEGLYPAPDMHEDAYYRFGSHEHVKDLKIPTDFMLCNSGLCWREVALAVGGWDTRFEAPASAFADFAARLQQFGSTMILQDDVAVRFGHQPGTSGDHGPIHHAYFENDLPLFRQLWSAGDAHDRKVVPLDNWKQSPEKWTRRFGP